ncbi:thioredoxin family protein [Capnocytophaga sp. ARDL2]|uniref:thioredoxin family protein n=1 Tax=Capnocytophaga sp. ARDL2 TaxID=3238809 RepID=UPI003556FD10
MAKFGEIINTPTPVLIQFTMDYNTECEQMSDLLYQVAQEMGSKLTIVKIDIHKNKELCEALRVKTAPTSMVYKNGSMTWKHEGVVDKQSLLMVAKAYN